ncbi:hypothetical protein ACTWMS_002203, partial [Salmonella enterica]
MPFHVGSGCLPAIISNHRIYLIALFNTQPEMSSWEKMTLAQIQYSAKSEIFVFPET